MDMDKTEAVMASSRKAVWVGWALSGLVALMFVFSAFLKIKGGPELDQGMVHLACPLPW